MAIKHSITLSTTEPNNEVGVIKIRQADEQTQMLEVQITENGVPKSYTGLAVYFCAKLGQTAGLGIIEQKLNPEEMTSPANGKLVYTMRAEDWQILGRQKGYFSFRKMKDEHEFVEQFTTRDFTFEVIKSVYSEGLKEVKTDGSTYVWTIEDMVRLFKEYTATGKTDWEEFVEQNRGILESVDPGGELLSEIIVARGESYQTLGERFDNQIGLSSDFRGFESEESFMKRVYNEQSERGVNVKWFGVKGDGVTDDYQALQRAIDSKLPLFFPPGMHSVIFSELSSNEINSLKIIGSGKARCSITQKVKDKRLIYVNGDNSDIRNITFRGNSIGFENESGENGALIDFIGKNFIIDNCGFEGADYLAILARETSGNGKIINCDFKGSWAEDIAYWANDGLITGNKFENTLYNAIVLRGSENSIIENNIFRNIGYGVDACIDIQTSHSLPKKVCKRVTISNNHFIDCYLNLGMSSADEQLHTDIVVKNNFFANRVGVDSYEIFIRISKCENFIFEGNIVENGGSVRSFTAETCTNVFIKGNHFKNLKGGVLVSAENLIEVSNNTFADVQDAAIALSTFTASPNTCIVKNNIFSGVGVGVTSIGIYVARVIANNNLFKDITTMSIDILYDIDYLEVVSNIFLTPSRTVRTKNVNNFNKRLNSNYDSEFGTARPGKPTNGQFFYDATLQKPIWYSADNWKDSNGTPV